MFHSKRVYTSFSVKTLRNTSITTAAKTLWIQDGRRFQSNLSQAEILRWRIWFKDKLHAEKEESWYKLRKYSVRQMRGHKIMLEIFDNSIPTAAMTLYPHYEWKLWKFRPLPSQFLNSLDEQKKLFEHIAMKENIIQLDDWYQAKPEKLRAKYEALHELLKVHESTLPSLLNKVYPNVDWLPWKFTYSPPRRDYWKDSDAQKKFLDWFEQTVGIKKEEWYKVSASQMKEHGGEGLLAWHQNSLPLLLSSVYSEYPWRHWLFVNFPPSRATWSNFDTRVQFFEWLKDELNIKSCSDWYAITEDHVKERGGKLLLDEHYKGSLASALVSVYPNEPWQFWQFRTFTVSLWDNTHNLVTYFDWLEKQLSIKQKEDWYTVNVTDVLSKGAKHFIQSRYGGNLHKVLSTVYPNFPWQAWKFAVHVPQETLQHHRDIFDSVAKKLKFESLDDWYKIKWTSIKDEDFQRVVHYFYGDSIIRALTHIYPQHKWLMWMFSSVPTNFWRDAKNQRDYLNWLGTQLGVKSYEDWYGIKHNDIKEKGVNMIREYYGTSLAKALTTVYPEYNWHLWRFYQAPSGFWTDKNNHRIFFDWVATQLGIREYHGWYSVKKSDVMELGGVTVLQHYYDENIVKAILSIYPEYNWQLWRFESVPAGFWDDWNNVTEFMHTIETPEEIGITDLSEWYAITIPVIERISKGGYVIRKYGGLFPLLSRMYPDYEWDAPSPFMKKSQTRLFQAVQRLFPEAKIQPDYKGYITFTEAREQLELDLYLPSMSLAFEYQGEPHFKFHFLAGEPMDRQEKDKEKREICKKQGLTLIEIPYWWDRRVDTLAATIHKIRPDLVPVAPPGASPIPEQLPAKILKKIRADNSAIINTLN